MKLQWQKQILECVDRSLRYICDVDLPFAGKIVIFSGDFRQILPVIKNGSRSQIISSTINRSYLWKYIKPNLFHLSSIKRAN